LLTIMAADMAVVGVAGTAVAAVGMEEAVIRALGGTALVWAGITLALAGMGVVVTGTPATGMVGVVAGIMAVAVAVGELGPQ